MTQARTTKLAAAAAAAVALAGLALSTSAGAASAPAAADPLAPAIATATATAAAAPVTNTDPTAAPVTPAAAAEPRAATVGSGVVDGTAWSVTLTYYPTTPADYAPGVKTRAGLVCLRTVLDGRANSRYGDCAGVKGPTDQSPRGMYGERTLPNGARLFIAQPAAAVVGATMTFGNAAPTTVTTVTVPGTDFTAYAVPVPAASRMSALDEYDAQHKTVGHQDF
ncbi:hypothetical protein [Kitasatospora sp. NPDC096140]|uniref:hypothetical protein n=1 Tax=Kitasatospora sp. NPDC096140 TaxID=3155425 RepID=UPI0033289732